jgi:circadian clock protein KaiC
LESNVLVGIEEFSKERTVTQDNRISTGVSGLDTLLGGGLLPGGVYLVMGRPGTGKTTLGNQACFSHVADGARAVYVTLLAETHTRMLRNIRSMSFFQPDLVGSQITYVGAYSVLRERRLPGLLALLRRVISDERPTLLVLDGLTSAHALDEPDAAMKEFVAELQVLTEMARCTTILLANMSAADAESAEHSMVDGMIELTFDTSLQRTVREIEVLKFRGSEHMLGRHDLEISQQGLVVRPNTEQLLARRTQPVSTSTHYRRVSTGIPNLDAMLCGGLLASSTTMLLGFSGSGKTMCSLHFLHDGAAKHEPGLYFGFYEKPPRLVESAEHLGIPMRQHQEAGLIDVVWHSPLRFGLDALAEKLLENVQRRQVKRVVIDGIDGFRQNNNPERTIRFITALVNELAALDVTVLITEETQKIFGPEVEVRVAGLSALVDNIILLEYLDVGSELKRLMSIVKPRGSRHENHIRELVITDHGIELAPDPTSADKILELGPRIRRRSLS